MVLLREIQCEAGKELIHQMPYDKQLFVIILKKLRVLDFS